MFPGAGGFEFVLIAVAALVVVGPKDLPVLLRRLGKWTAKVRGMANEFRASFDEMARQSELDELRHEVEALRSQQYVRPLGEDLENHFREIGADLQDLPVPQVSITPPADAMMTAPEPLAAAKPRRKAAGTQRPDARRAVKTAPAAKAAKSKTKPAAKAKSKAPAKRAAPAREARARKAPPRKPARKARR